MGHHSPSYSAGSNGTPFTKSYSAGSNGTPFIKLLSR